MPVSTSRYSWRAICAVAQGPQNKAQQASSKPSTPVHLRADGLSEYADGLSEHTRETTTPALISGRNTLQAFDT